MPPIRRYLRISKYTVLECRIYLDNPSDSRWLLDGRDPVLRRIFAAIRPLVPAKLREENERLFSRKKGKPVKDVIAEEDFEVSLFLRESRTRHSLLTRYKEFEDNPDQRTTSAVAGTAETGIIIDSEDEDVDLHAIPRAYADNEETHRKRGPDPEDSGEGESASKRQRNESPVTEDKKLRFRTNYEGFNIFGWVLCLLVTRKGGRPGARMAASEPGHQPLMEEWISSQAQVDLDEE
ncbi:hypothetical protein BDV59DRAFT_101461 [Aspergillus ambiguus]|uniref:uncharacterized protein n=1 Tax=Aspergillus ambiguus TaxID=176160 RepID=UPI003CCD10CF